MIPGIPPHAAGESISTVCLILLAGWAVWNDRICDRRQTDDPQWPRAPRVPVGDDEGDGA